MGRNFPNTDRRAEAGRVAFGPTRCASRVWGLLALGLSACIEPTSAPPEKTPIESARPIPGLTATPHEQIVAGHLLVEFRRGATPPIEQPPSPATFLPPEENPATVVLADERLILERELWPPPASDSPLGQRDPQAGQIVLLRRDGVDESATLALMDKVASDPQVRRVEPDRLRHATSVPNDTLWSSQWALPLIRMPRAWDISTGSPDVAVAILDTGIIHDHPDLESRLIPGYDFISRPASADDGDRVRDSDPTDTGTVDTSRLHGSHVAGIIGAVSGNAMGIAGVDQKCRLLPVRVLGVKNGDGIDSDITDALRWLTGAQLGTIPVVSRKVDVVNMSFGGPGLSFTLQRAVDEVISAGLIVVVAAGNGGTDTTTYSPGGLDNVISVGASDAKGKRAVYSNYGPRVDLLAPGGGLSEWDYETDLAGLPPDGILSTYRDEGVAELKRPPFTYSPLTGTSQAAPHVAGIAALARSLVPTVRQRTMGLLLRTAANAKYRCASDDLSGCGAGLVDAESTLLLTQLQKRCGCEGDLYCVDGTCQTPPQIHDSIWDRPLVRGGYCQLGLSSEPAAGPWLGLFTAALVLLLLFALKARPKA